MREEGVICSLSFCRRDSRRGIFAGFVSFGIHTMYSLLPCKKRQKKFFFGQLLGHNEAHLKRKSKIGACEINGSEKKVKSAS